MATGGVGHAILTGEVLAGLRKLTTSTGWNTVSAVFKDRLANALASGNSKLANAMIKTQMAALPSTLPPPPRPQASDLKVSVKGR